MLSKLAVSVNHTAWHYGKGEMRPSSMFFEFSIKFQTKTTFPHTKFSIFWIQHKELIRMTLLSGFYIIIIYIIRQVLEKFDR